MGFVDETQTNSCTITLHYPRGPESHASWEIYVTAVNSAGESLPSNTITVALPPVASGTGCSGAQRGVVIPSPQGSTTINITDDLSNATYSKGVLWLRQEITTPFTVEFSYFAGGGTGGDGLTFMFYKKKYTLVPYGGTLGTPTSSICTLSQSWGIYPLRSSNQPTFGIFTLNYCGKAARITRRVSAGNFPRPLCYRFTGLSTMP